MNITEQDLLSTGFVRVDWTHDNEQYHEWILGAGSGMKIEVYEDFSCALIVGHECRSLPKTTGIEELKSLARILCICHQPENLSGGMRTHVYKGNLLELYH